MRTTLLSCHACCQRPIPAAWNRRAGTHRCLRSRLLLLYTFHGRRLWHSPEESRSDPLLLFCGDLASRQSNASRLLSHSRSSGRTLGGGRRYRLADSHRPHSLVAADRSGCVGSCCDRGRARAYSGSDSGRIGADAKAGTGRVRAEDGRLSWSRQASLGSGLFGSRCMRMWSTFSDCKERKTKRTTYASASLSVMAPS